MKKLHYFLLIFLLPTLGFSQVGKFDVRLSYESYSCEDGKISVLVEVKASAENSTFNMGDATMRFDYKLDQVRNPVLKTQHNFSSSATPKDFNYQSQAITKAESGTDGILSLNIMYAGLNDGAKSVSTNWIPISTIEFDLLSSTKCIDLTWHDNIRTPITGMSRIITPGSLPVALPITGEQFLNLNHCVTEVLPEAAISASPNSINSGESSTLTVTLTRGEGNWGFVLSDGTTVTNSTKTSESFTVSPTATTVYSITSLNDKCVTNDFSSGAPSATLAVAPADPCKDKPLPTASITASPTSIIQGQSSTLTVTLTGGTGNWSATLSDGSTISTSTEASKALLVSPTTTTTYTITSLSDACGTNAFPTNAPEVTIGVLPDENPCRDKPLPTAFITASPTSITQGQSSTLTVTLTGGTGNWSATLSDGSTITNSAEASKALLVSPTTTTTYTITSLSDACATNSFPTNAPEVTVGVLPDENQCQGKICLPVTFKINKK